MRENVGQLAWPVYAVGSVTTDRTATTVSGAPPRELPASRWRGAASRFIVGNPPPSLGTPPFEPRLFAARVGTFAESLSIFAVHVSVFAGPWWAPRRACAALHGEAGRIRGEGGGINGEATPMYACISEMQRSIVVTSP